MFQRNAIMIDITWF